MNSKMSYFHFINRTWSVSASNRSINTNPTHERNTHTHTYTRFRSPPVPGHGNHGNRASSSASRLWVSIITVTGLYDSVLLCSLTVLTSSLLASSWFLFLAAGSNCDDMWDDVIGAWWSQRHIFRWLWSCVTVVQSLVHHLAAGSLEQRIGLGRWLTAETSHWS
jgi:hypothetical protein